jgi:selenocysteine lyase/cysteine desulfurase
MSAGAAKLGDRSLFPDLEPRVYAHHAAIAPVSTVLQAAVADALRRYAADGAGAFPEFYAQRQRLRGKLEALIHAEAGSVALTSNTTRGVSDVALSVPWRPGDRVILFKGEFPANVTPWQQAARLYQLELSWHDASDYLSGRDDALQRLDRDLQRGVRIVAVSAVQFQTGLRMPLEEIGRLCRQHGAELFVDAIQGCGAIPLDVQQLGIQYLACGGHKWLMGMEGSGFLYVAPASAQKLVPIVAGWQSHEEAEDFLSRGAGLLRYDKPLKRSALALETSTLSVLGFVALEAGLDLVQHLGVAAISAHLSEYLDRLETILLGRGFRSLRAKDTTARSTILSVLPPQPLRVLDVHRGLAQRGIICGVPDGILRFSPHWPNAFSEVDVVAAALDEIITAQ